AAALLNGGGFAYLPLAAISPALEALLQLRRVLGLRSPLNTAARLLDPFDARAGVDGVFHPAYIALHLATAERLGRPRLVVVKGGGGEAERTALKPVTAHWFDQSAGRGEAVLPPVATQPVSDGDHERAFLAAWHDGHGADTAVATVALGLIALGEPPDTADAKAAEVWRYRRR
ncbi:MAG: hypothetical protein H7Z10_02945, partial [Gemmatimonadaceae bacterium]|nr:hypothetical protein [Acetobacteraceae bacterium]